MSLCDNCGFEISEDEKFCSNCGSPVQKGGNFSSLGEFDTSSKMKPTPTTISENKVWTEGSLIDASSQMLINPGRVAPKLMQDPQSPNSIGLVAIYSFLVASVTYITQMKTTTTIIDDDVPDIYRAQLQVSDNPSISTAIMTIVMLFVVWYVGSWLLSLFVKSGFPVNTTLSVNSFPAMRKLNGYRFLPAIFAYLIVIILLLLQPDQTVTYTMQPSPFMGELVGDIPTPSYSGFSFLYLFMVSFLPVIANIYSIYMLYKSIMANNYKGTGFYVVLVILVGSVLLSIKTLLQL